VVPAANAIFFRDNQSVYIHIYTYGCVRLIAFLILSLRNPLRTKKKVQSRRGTGALPGQTSADPHHAQPARAQWEDTRDHPSTQSGTNAPSATKPPAHTGQKRTSPKPAPAKPQATPEPHGPEQPPARQGNRANPTAAPAGRTRGNPAPAEQTQQGPSRAPNSIFFCDLRTPRAAHFHCVLRVNRASGDKLRKKKKLFGVTAQGAGEDGCGVSQSFCGCPGLGSGMLACRRALATVVSRRRSAPRAARASPTDSKPA
jgi:hypothetical protein